LRLFEEISLVTQCFKLILAAASQLAASYIFSFVFYYNLPEQIIFLVDFIANFL